MKRSGRVPWGEVRLGMVIIFAFAVLLWAAFNGTGMTFFKKTNALHAYFTDVGGLASGSPVWLGGIEVGHVSSIKFVDVDGVGKIHVRFRVKDEAWEMVSSESHVAIGTIGLMGDKYLSLGPRQPGQPGAIEGAELQVEAAGDMSTAFASAPEMMENLTQTLHSLNSVLKRVEKGEGFLGRITSDGESSDGVDSLVVASRQLMRDLNESQKRLVRSVETASIAFDSLADGVLHGGGSLSKLVWDTTLYANLTSMTHRADNMVAKWETGEGTISKLANDSSMYVQARELILDTRALLDDIMADPRKYFKFSVF